MAAHRTKRSLIILVILALTVYIVTDMAGTGLESLQLRNILQTSVPVADTVNKLKGKSGYVITTDKAPRPHCPNISLSDEVTVLTAMFDIGAFPKGSPTAIRKPETYVQWMEMFKNIDNPLVAFTDNRTYFEKFKILRAGFPPERSRIFLIDSSKLWAFSISKEIKAIFQQPGYPRHYPNTVYEKYTCLTHAKYELLQKAISEKFFPTKYITWVDIGLYRNFNFSAKFHVGLPSNFEESKVVLQQVNPFKELPVSTIIKGNINWVGGGMLLGRWDKVMTFTEDYIQAVKELLKRKLMNVEQHVIYSMYTKSFYFRPRVKIQIFNSGGWFGLARETRASGEYNGTRTTVVPTCAQNQSTLLTSSVP